MEYVPTSSGSLGVIAKTVLSRLEGLTSNVTANSILCLYEYPLCLFLAVVRDIVISLRSGTDYILSGINCAGTA